MIYRCQCCASRGGVSFDHLTTDIIQVYVYMRANKKYNLLWTRGPRQFGDWGETFNISTVRTLSRHGNIITTLSSDDARRMRSTVLGSGAPITIIPRRER